MNDESHDHDLIDELADEFLNRRLTGETPSVSEYCRRHPELEDEIRELFPMLMLLEDAKDHSAGSMPGDTPPPQQIGRYCIVREIGRGGMGIVYEAEEEHLGRRVALKVLPPRLSSDERILARFQREARAVAKLHHTNIVPLFEVGDDDGRFFIAMQLIHGRSLDHPLAEPATTGAEPANGDVPVRDHAKANGDSSSGVGDAGLPAARAAGPPPDSTHSGAPHARRFMRIADIGMQTADALAYAHERGIVHRDIKPSNLLLDGRGIVWLTDFGLAKTDDEDLTQTGDFLGTLRYMAPERLRGQCDARADVYSLGLTLYELLVDRPAFDAPDRLALVDAINQQTPPPPRTVDRDVPRDLETIVLKAIDRERNARYASARALAEDLHRFLNDLPVHARRITLIESLYRWARRNRGLAAALATISLLLLVLAGGSTLAAWQFKRQESIQRVLTSEKQAEAERAQLAEASIQRSLYNARMFTAAIGLSESGGITQVRQLTAATHPSRTGTDLRGWEWFYLRSLCDRESVTLERHNAFAWSTDWHPSARLVATSGGDGQVRIWDVAQKKLEQEFTRDGQVRSVRWSPDGKSLAVGHGVHFSVWDFESGKERFRREGAHTAVVWHVEWSPDATRLATVSQDAAIRLWDAETGAAAGSFDDHAPNTAVFALAWSPDGTMLATGGEEEIIRVWNTDTRKTIRIFKRHPRAVRSLSFSPDGRQLASASSDRTLAVRDVKDGRNSFSMLAPSSVESVMWSPDGRLLATGDWDGMVRVYDVAARTEVHALHGHEDRVWDVRWSPDGTRLASACLTGFVKLWDYATPDEDVILSDRGRSDLNSVEWHPHELRLAATSGTDVLLWDEAAEGVEPRRLEGHQEGLHEVRWSPDGQFVASSSYDGTVRIWPTAGTPAPLVLTVPGCTGLAWHPRGTHLAIASGTLVTLRDAKTGESTGRLPDQMSRIASVDWSPDGRTIATAGLDAVVRLYDAHTHEMTNTLEGHQAVLNTVRWSPDGRHVASAGYNRVIRVHEAATGREVCAMRGHSRPIREVSWNPDGARVASVGGDPLLRIWDAQTGAQVAAMSGHSLHIRAVDWSPDGVHLVSCSWDKTIRIWNAARGYASGEHAAETTRRSPAAD